MIGIIVVIAWGALRFVQPDTGPYVMQWVAWLVSFVTPKVSQEMLDTGEKITGMAAWPLYLKKEVLPLYIVGGIIALLGIWFAFRIVNMPKVAEFLIAVEAEMVKVSWPNKKEVYVTTIVVIIVMMIFCVLLACYDLLWHYLFQLIGVL